MNAVILLGTLKVNGFSNTATLTEFFIEYLKKSAVQSEVIKLVDYNILPGTYTNMGEGDQWPAIFDKLVAADIIIFATPIWWGNHSSETQKVIERLDEVHDQIQSGNTSKLLKKAVGIIITGDSDGSQHIIGNISNFINALGMVIPPYCTLSVQLPEHKKGADTPKEKLLEKYRQEYSKTAQTMVEQLVEFVKK
jgi:multimeric flavodoxin WrbA